MKRLLMTVACSLLWIGPASAQTCLGTMTFKDAQTQVGGNVLFHSSAFGLNVGAAKGFEQFFGRAGLGIEKISDLDGIGKTLVLSGGTEIAAGPDKKYSVCPVVGFFKRFGPSPGLNLNSGEWLVNGGVSVGFAAMQSGTTDIVPNVAFAINRSSVSVSGNGFDSSFAENFVALNLGVGLIFDKGMSVTPSIVLPLNGDASTVFQVSFAKRFGR